MGHPLKAYILVPDDIPLGFAMVAVAHAGAALILQMEPGTGWDDEDFHTWLRDSFKKVVCKVTREQFEKAKETTFHYLLTESSLGGKEVALVFKPRMEWPDAFKTFPLYR